MKLKYLYQQMLAFWAVIFTILILVGVSFTQFTKRSMETTTYQQLRSYAESAVENISLFDQYYADKAIYLSAQFTESLLTSQNVKLYILNDKKEIVFPAEYYKTSKVHIVDDLWKKIKSGYNTQTIANTDILGEKGKTAYAMLPLVQQDGTFYGAIVVTQPLSQINNSIALLTENLLKAFLISSIVALIISYFFAKFQVNRINRMRKATQQIADGNFDIHLESNEKDELDDLAKDFNQMAVALKKSNDEVERQEERRRQFMADAAHEMRTPLTTINGLLEGLAYDAIPENQKQKGITLMQNETKRLIRLVNENLDYEKIRTNQISIVIQKIDATQTLRNILNQLEGKAEAAGDQLLLSTEEEIDVFADYDRFVQIMVNIIQNAIQFTENGTITVSIEKGYLETIIKISDTGIGMTEEELQNIWDRYYKADSSRKNTKYGESGLGLSIVHQLVKLHKGKIQVESQKNMGTTFTISFPDIELTEERDPLQG